LLDALQKLPSIGGERFHIAPLTFGVNGVEGERGLARARDPGYDRETIVRNFKINVLEIVNACPANKDGFRGHLWKNFSLNWYRRLCSPAWRRRLNASARGENLSIIPGAPEGVQSDKLDWQKRRPSKIPANARVYQLEQSKHI